MFEEFLINWIYDSQQGPIINNKLIINYPEMSLTATYELIIIGVRQYYCGVDRRGLRKETAVKIITVFENWLLINYKRLTTAIIKNKSVIQFTDTE